MARTDPQINIRLPASLKAQIEAAAKTNVRSMNAEIIDRLQATFQIDKTMQRVERVIKIKSDNMIADLKKPRPEIEEMRSRLAALEKIVDDLGTGRK